MFYNPVLIGGAVAWFMAQFIKVLLNLIKFRRFDMERIFGSGGMPSSHSSTVCAAATVVCRLYGSDSAIFGVMVIMSVIVMYDAMNVRYHAGVQAKELNIIRKELKNNKVLNEDFINKISGNELKELLGHTPLEVLCGAVLGIAIGIIVPVLRI
ncbi:MAG: divergent PAP2 family protein [Oscillospiraceae bacterium]